MVVTCGGSFKGSAATGQPWALVYRLVPRLCPHGQFLGALYMPETHPCLCLAWLFGLFNNITNICIKLFETVYSCISFDCHGSVW